MRKIFKISVVFILVLSMVTGMGLSAYTTETDETFDSIGEGTVVVQDEPTDKSEEMPAEPEEPVVPENPEEPANPEGPENPPVDPNIPPIVPVPPTTPTANPSIHIEVSTDKNSYLAGEIINYIIKVTNTGNVVLENVILEDEFLGQKSIGILEVGEEQIFNEEYSIQLDNGQEILSNFINVVGYYGETEVISGSSFTINVETPQIGTLNYTVKYFIDGEEQIELEINNQVPADNPIVEEVPHDNMPEGYMIDEEFSTILPFMVTETENIIEVYYVLELEIMLMASNMNYNSDSQVFPLHMISNNDFTKVALAWFYGGELYLGIGSMHNAPLETISYGLGGSATIGSVVERATSENIPLTINGVPYPIGQFYPSNTKAYWNVVNLGGVTLTTPFTVNVNTKLGKGHDVVGEDNIEIKKSLLVYHQYDNEQPILDLIQSNILDSNMGYSVHPEYVNNNIDYSLVEINIIYNGIQQPSKGESNLQAGFLIGTVPLDNNANASAIITFIYMKANDGKLTITKKVNGEYVGSQEFDIFIYGPSGKKYVVTLIDEESITLTGLEYGNYSVKEVVPMNYKLVGMTNGGVVTISKTNKHLSVTVTNEYTNDGWFFDDDPKINSFTVGGRISQKSMPVESRLVYSKLEYFLVPVELEKDFKFDNA